MIIFTACGDSTAEKSSAQVQASEEVAELLQAETFKIIPAAPYTPADLDIVPVFTSGGSTFTTPRKICAGSCKAEEARRLAAS